MNEQKKAGLSQLLYSQYLLIHSNDRIESHDRLAQCYLLINTFCLLTVPFL
jgi:hypothetical protein